MAAKKLSGDCLPQNKVEFVRQTRARGYRVAVVGDGVNDAPALAAGDLGIAMGAAGSEVAIHSATIALMNNDLRRLPFLLRLSRETRRVINQNFLLGICFVIGGLVLAAMKFINPILAAVFHVTGALLVVFNSFRLMRQGEELEPHEVAVAATPNRAQPFPGVMSTLLGQTKTCSANVNEFSFSLTVVLAIYCALVLLASLAGGWLLLAMRLTHARLQMAVSFVAGLMLSIALLHFIPHATHQTQSLDRTVHWAWAASC